MNKKLARRLNATGLTVKDKMNFKGWQHGVNDLTTRQRKRLEKKVIRK
tara:strand:- start:305 stop:448 length:144 start_codon:yes stop_codon:yes gene_type:complete